METSKNASKKVVSIKDSNSTEKRKCKVKYTKNKTKMQYMTGTGFNTKKTISYYVNDRTDG